MLQDHPTYPAIASARGNIACRKRSVAGSALEHGSRSHYGFVEKRVILELEMCAVSCQPVVGLSPTSQVEHRCRRALVPKHILGARVFNPQHHLKSLHTPQDRALYTLPVKSVPRFLPCFGTDGRGPTVSLSGRRGLCVSLPSSRLTLSQSNVVTDKADEHSSLWHKVMNRFKRNSRIPAWKHRQVFKLLEFDEL